MNGVKTFSGLLLIVIGYFLPDLGEEQAALMADEIVQLVGLALAAYGRVKAAGPIGGNRERS